MEFEVEVEVEVDLEMFQCCLMLEKDLEGSTGAFIFDQGVLKLIC